MNTLDLGCGSTPQNPFGAEKIYGVDLVRNRKLNIKKADLAIEPIPFRSSYFDYVTAYDFIEHIPRLLYINGERKQPFIDLMNEIWRVLKPGGILKAHTPAFPKGEAFQDPTHVNFITEETLNYFLEPSSLIRSYGFKGLFEKITMHWDQTATYHLVWEIKAVK